MKNIDKLIQIYFYICDCYDTELYLHNQRQSNHYQPKFTDTEVMTIFLYATIVEKRKDKKEVYDFADNYLRSWFPNLCKSYEGYLGRLNNLSGHYISLINRLLMDKMYHSSYEEFVLLNQYLVSLVDSMPIIVAKGNRSFSAKVAKDICDKSYCASKKLHYYGLKLHLIGFKRFGRLPLPEYIGTTPASHNDLTVIKPIVEAMNKRVIVGDKLYGNQELNEWLEENREVKILTPVKKKKGQERLEAADQFYSTAVSQLRQPVEGIFGWMIERTGLQNASKNRSSKGVLTHVYGKIAAACMMMTLECLTY